MYYVLFILFKFEILHSIRLINEENLNVNKLDIIMWIE